MASIRRCGRTWWLAPRSGSTRVSTRRTCSRFRLCRRCGGRGSGRAQARAVARARVRVRARLWARARIRCRCGWPRRRWRRHSCRRSRRPCPRRRCASCRRLHVWVGRAGAQRRGVPRWPRRVVAVKAPLRVQPVARGDHPRRHWPAVAAARAWPRRMLAARRVGALAAPCAPPAPRQARKKEGGRPADRPVRHTKKGPACGRLATGWPTRE